MLLINILLVDDHVLFSKSLEIALSDYPEIEAFKSINDISLLDIFIEEDAPDILLIVILSGYNLSVYRNEAKKSVQKDLSTKIQNQKR